MKNILNKEPDLIKKLEIAYKVVQNIKIKMKYVIIGRPNFRIYDDIKSLN